MELFVDPVVLALPAAHCSAETLRTYVLRLSEWSAEARDSGHDFFVSRGCAYALARDNIYPDGAALRRLWSSADCKISVNYQTVATACRRITNNVPYLEARVQSEHVAVECGSVHVDPDLVRRLPEGVASAFKEALGCVAYAREELKHPRAMGLMMVTHPIRDGDEAHVRAEVLADDDTSTVESAIPMIQSTAELRRIEGLGAFWRDSESAIAWAVSDLCEKGYPLEHELAKFSVAPEFNQSIEDQHYDARLDRLVQIFHCAARLLTSAIPHVSTKRHHRLKRNHSEIVEHDESSGRTWEAWRVWVTEGEQALRLHYWWEDGQFTLSKVGPHEDYRIGPIGPGWSRQ